MKEIFIDKNFRQGSLDIIDQANDIISEYRQQGFTLTLRQLYYQFVARGLFGENTMRMYKKLGSIVNDGRLAGLIDWDAIEDRTRYLRSNSHWSDGSSIINSCVHSFAVDKWDNQDCRLEVWIEKDALVGVIETICDDYDIPYFACRGYASQSELYRAGKRLGEYYEAGQHPIVIHLGDHDPSGIDMTRDNDDRLNMFAGCNVEIIRVALNWDQVQTYKPPPNPAKLTDTRAKEYIKNYGSESWELDALDPTVIATLIKSKVDFYRDPDLWDIKLDYEQTVKNELIEVRDDFSQRGI